MEVTSCPTALKFSTAQQETIAMLDLTVMLGPGGRERTRAEFNQLLRAPVLRLRRSLRPRRR
jgi:hypothetical protein